MVLPLPVALEKHRARAARGRSCGVVVGGSVRDALLGLRPKDFDIEVYGISYDNLATFLATRGAWIWWAKVSA